MRFSVLIPAYKDAFLGECIDSVLRQNYDDFEIVIVNDASPGKVDDIVSGFNDKKIKYFKNSIGNGGYDLVNTWNQCIEKSSGDYVICMGDDDRLLKNCLSDYDKLIEKNPEVNVYHTRTQFINKNSEVTGIAEARAAHESAYDFIWSDIYTNRRQFIGDFLFNAGKLKNKGGFYKLPWGWVSDRITVVMMAEDKGICDTQTFGFQYRDSSMSVTCSSAIAKDKIEAWKKAREWYAHFFEKHNSFDDISDRITYEFVIKGFDEYATRYEKNEIMTDVHNSPMNIINWIKICNDYGIGKLGLIRQGLRGLKDKI